MMRRQHTCGLEGEMEGGSEKDDQRKGWHLTDHKVEVHVGGWYILCCSYR